MACSVVGSSFRNRVNSLPSSALVPTISGTWCAAPVFIASIGIQRQEVVAVGGTDREGAVHVVHAAFEQHVERR